MADTERKTRLVAKTAKLRSTRLVAPSEPQKLGNYTLTTCLGSGGMGSVYRAHDDKLDRTVAIKLMLSKFSNSPEVLTSFRREAQAAAKLNHPNIAQIYSFGEDNGRPYIAMEYVSGDHFDKLILRKEPLDQAMVMKIGMDIAGGLAVAADASLIHGDIKPENIVFDDHGVPKLLDFGIASASNAKTTEIWGTPYYIAPEKLKKQRVDFRSDIYCLGGTLYHALTKHPPFDGDDVKEVVKARLVKPPVPLSSYRPDIDPEVEAIILRMLQVDPADRYPTYGALLNDIRKYLRRARPQMIPVTTEMLFVTTQFIAEAAAEKNVTRPVRSEGGAEKTKGAKKGLFADSKSQLLLLLTLVAFFPYFILFYSGLKQSPTSETVRNAYLSGAPHGQHIQASAAQSVPVVTQPVQTSAAQPVQTSAAQPVQASVTQPVQASVTQPVQASVAQPVPVVTQPPVEMPLRGPVELPVQPSAQASAQPIPSPVPAVVPSGAAQNAVASPVTVVAQPPAVAVTPAQNTSSATPSATQPAASAQPVAAPPPVPVQVQAVTPPAQASVPPASVPPASFSAAAVVTPSAPSSSSLPTAPAAVAAPSVPAAVAAPSVPAVAAAASSQSSQPLPAVTQSAPAAVAHSTSSVPEPQVPAQNPQTPAVNIPSRSPSSAADLNPRGGVVEIPSIDEGPRQKWPELRVTATMGAGSGGSALVNGDVVTVGFTMQSGVKLTAVGPHYAEFCLKGEYKRVVVNAQARKENALNGKKK